MFFILQEGVRTVDAAYVRPFMDLGAIRADSGAGSYIDLPKWTGNAIDSPPCQKAGLANIRFPIDLDIYNVQAQQDVYDLFAKTTKETPALNGSMLLFEGYSTQGVKAVDSKSTAFPFRSDNLLVSPVIIYKEDGAALGEKAAVLGESLRQILHRGNGRAYMHTYVNYAYGGETVENWYGAENWRQTKLKALKKKYDPHGRFNFYAPIA
ncbi:hypothetical protein QQS21_008972 [Conoideocrella luteorostrata]|uniref:Berberine/berberine-like domain-containing protein n=1 Tax=Conoideocrella luteorostrata TaxID=1105319 RepID=A0AAJ0CKI5_9HYPO|nr:hypothetical protein QQS21_008972 [Conoideocrella luteorostrata]